MNFCDIIYYKYCDLIRKIGVLGWKRQFTGYKFIYTNITRCSTDFHYLTLHINKILVVSLSCSLLFSLALSLSLFLSLALFFCSLSLSLSLALFLSIFLSLFLSHFFSCSLLSFPHLSLSFSLSPVLPPFFSLSLYLYRSL